MLLLSQVVHVLLLDIAHDPVFLPVDPRDEDDARVLVLTIIRCRKNGDARRVFIFTCPFV